MSRPKKFRQIDGSFGVVYYKPRGVGLSDLEQVDLNLDEIEALRLVDFEGLNMEDAADRMRISKPTLCRLVNVCRCKLADAICNGKAISIVDADNFIYLTKNTMPNLDGTGPDGEGPKTGRQMGNCEGAKGSEVPLRRGRRAGYGRRPAGRGRGKGRNRI